MRCEQCGGILRRYLLDISGDWFYKCSTGLCRLTGNKMADTHIYPCETVHDKLGNVFSGTIAYEDGGRTRMITVKSGKEL